MAARSDARKRREEPALDRVERALELLADALANAVRVGAITEPSFECEWDVSWISFARPGDGQTIDFYDMIYSRLEPF